MKTCLAVLFGVFAAVGCAVGDDDGVGDSVDATLRPAVDATMNPFPDAHPAVDARPDGNPQSLPDGGLPGFPDASLSPDGGGLPGTCTTSADCPTDQCCFAVFGLCIDGQEVPVFGCLPN